MDLSAGQQKALFAVVVVVLAGLGIYLIAPHNSKQPPPGRSAAPSSPPQAAGSPTVLDKARQIAKEKIASVQPRLDEATARKMDDLVKKFAATI